MPTHYTSDNLISGLATTGSTAGSVLFVGSDLTVTENNSKFSWDNTNNRLTVTGTYYIHGAGTNYSKLEAWASNGRGSIWSWQEGTANEASIKIDNGVFRLGVGGGQGGVLLLMQNSDTSFTVSRPDAGRTFFKAIDAGDTPTLTIGTLSATLLARTATNPLFVVKGAASQSGNLTEWQNTSGTPLSVVDASGKIGISKTSSLGAMLHVDQSSTTGALPVITVDQADVSEEFIRFIGSSANGVLTQSIVEEADIATATRAGFLKVYVQDDGNQLTDQAYYVPIYTLA